MGNFTISEKTSYPVWHFYEETNFFDHALKLHFSPSCCLSMSSECGKLGRMEYLWTLAWVNNIYIMVNIITYIQNGIFWNIWGHLLESIFPSLALPTAGCLQYTTIQNTFTSYFWTCQNYFKYWKVKISRISKMSLYFPHSYFTQ